MSSADYKEWILHVIDQLRRRKARPDLQRICHFVERKYGLSRGETEAHVERLVDTGAVVKVHYKRGTSYRNAAKARKRIYSTQILNSNNLSRKIKEAVQSIVKEKRENKTQNGEGNVSSSTTETDGASTREIETWLSSRKDAEPLMCPMHFALQREVEAERLVKLGNGNYVVSPEGPSAEQLSPPTNEKILMKSTSVVAKRGRPPKKKQAGISRSFSCGDVFPAPQPIPTTSSSSPDPLCDFCQQTAACNRLGEPEELLFCKDCSAKAHPSCMEYSPALASRARNSPWQCIDCKTCCICYDPGDADAMLFCDACDKGYHMFCHEPNVNEKPQGKWVCTECVVEGITLNDVEGDTDGPLAGPGLEVQDSSDSVMESHVSSPVEDHSTPNTTSSWQDSVSTTPSKKLRTENSLIYPYAAGWSVGDVVDFFQSRGFTEQAEAFREQEIDGQSLLLMRRSDVLQGLSLKLGPALKIYKHVTKLQTAVPPSTGQVT